MEAATKIGDDVPFDLQVDVFADEQGAGLSPAILDALAPPSADAPADVEHPATDAPEIQPAPQSVVGQLPAPLTPAPVTGAAQTESAPPDERAAKPAAKPETRVAPKLTNAERDEQIDKLNRMVLKLFAQNKQLNERVQALEHSAAKAPSARNSAGRPAVITELPVLGKPYSRIVENGVSIGLNCNGQSIEAVKAWNEKQAAPA